MLHHATLRKILLAKLNTPGMFYRASWEWDQSFFSNALMPSQQGSEGNSKLSQENTKAAAPEAHRRESTVVLREYGEK